MAALSKLKTMSNEEIQNWLRKVDAISLGIALLGVDDEIKSCVLRNMSERAANMLRENMDVYEAMSAKELIIYVNASILESLI